MTRLLRPLTTALALALMVFLFAGCGGGDEQATNTSTKKASTTSTSKSSASSSKRAANQVKPEDLIGQVVVPTENTPEDFTQSINDRRPIAVTFYILGPTDDSKVRTSMSNLESRYDSDMDFYIYLQSDGERYKDLATLLNVNTTPTVVIINDQARVVAAWTGYADDKSLEQGIVEALP
jgi:Tfp pilus assembly protein FimT